MSLRAFSRQPLLIRIARRYTATVPVVAVLGILSGGLEGAGIGLLVPLLGTLLGSAQTPGGGGVVRLLDRFAEGLAGEDRLLAIGAAMLACIVLKNLLQTGSRILVADVDGRLGHDIRRALADRLLTVPYVFHLDHAPARLFNIIATESWHASDAVRAGFSRVESIAVASVFGVMLAVVDWRLTLVMGVGVLALRLVQARFLKPLERLGERVTSGNSVLHDRMMAGIQEARVVRLFARQDDELRRFEAASDAVRRVMFKASRLSTAIWPTLEVLHVCLFLGILIVAAHAGVSLPQLAAFLVLVNRLQPHLRAVENATTALAAGAAQVAEVEWLLGAPTPPAATLEPLAFPTLRRGVRFDDVSFAYPSRPAAPSLRGASFTIRAGRSTALIGASGSGKTTVINLLCGLIRPASGSIEVDGVRLDRIDLSDWLATIGIAGQDVDLSDGTIEDNIRFGRHDLTDEQIRDAARDAEAHRFIESLPAGYATRVGSSGQSLSGGQRQRIGIARAIARRPSLLILDEATNSVDGLSETAIFELLHRLPGKPTIVVISHRVSTLALCDDAIVIDAGIVIERGTLASSRAYQRMAALG